jgi:hypothetical protein
LASPENPEQSTLFDVQYGTVSPPPTPTSRERFETAQQNGMSGEINLSPSLCVIYICSVTVMMCATPQDGAGEAVKVALHGAVTVRSNKNKRGLIVHRRYYFSVRSARAVLLTSIDCGVSLSFRGDANGIPLVLAGSSFSLCACNQSSAHRFHSAPHPFSSFF